MPDQRSILCMLHPPEDLKHLLGFLLRDDHHKGSLTGQVHRIQPQHIGHPAHGGSHRDCLTIQLYPDSAFLCDLVQHCSYPAAGRVTDHMDIRNLLQDSLNIVPQRSAVALHLRFNPILITLQEDTAAVASDVSGHQHAVPGLCMAAGGIRMIQNPAHAGRRDEYAIHLPFSCYLRVTGYDLHPGFLRCRFHGRDDLFELIHRKPFLDDKRTGHIQRLCPHAGQVIDRAADGKLPDIPSPEKSRRDDESVRCHCDPTVRCGQHRRIIRREIRIGKMRLEYLPDQF